MFVMCATGRGELLRNRSCWLLLAHSRTHSCVSERGRKIVAHSHFHGRSSLWITHSIEQLDAILRSITIF